MVLNMNATAGPDVSHGMSSPDFDFATLLSPYAPHLAEEMWCILNEKLSLSNLRKRYKTSM